ATGGEVLVVHVDPVRRVVREDRGAVAGAPVRLRLHEGIRAARPERGNGGGDRQDADGREHEGAPHGAMMTGVPGTTSRQRRSRTSFCTRMQPFEIERPISQGWFVP